jgi:4'-phosphopantetheinyl transferase
MCVIDVTNMTLARTKTLLGMIIRPKTIYIWFAFPDEIQDEKLLAEYLTILPSAELEQLTKFRHIRHQHRFLIGRVLTRTILSSCTSISPESLLFSRNSYGRPSLQHSAQSSSIRFNLSYTEGLVAFALTSGQEVGVDVENTRVDIDCLGIAKQYFSRNELKDLVHLPQEHLKERFFEYWTLKESYIKAKGLGLSMPLNQFSFSLCTHGSDQITISPLPTKKSEFWQFKLLDPSPHHKAALSVCRDNESHFKISVKKMVPLRSENHFPQAF